MRVKSEIELSATEIREIIAKHLRDGGYTVNAKDLRFARWSEQGPTAVYATIETNNEPEPAPAPPCPLRSQVCFAGAHTAENDRYRYYTDGLNVWNLLGGYICRVDQLREDEKSPGAALAAGEER